MTLLGIALGRVAADRVADRVADVLVADVQQARDLIVVPAIRSSQSSAAPVGASVLGNLSGDSRAKLRSLFQPSDGKSNLKNVALWSSPNDVVFQTFPDANDQASVNIAAALRGSVVRSISNSKTGIGSGLPGEYLEIVVPLSVQQKPVVDGAFQVFVDYYEISALIDRDRSVILRRSIGAMLALWTVLATFLFMIARRLEKSEQGTRALIDFDQLTGLPNRRSLEKAVAIRIKKSKKSDRMCAMLLLDLNRFKEVNDTLGHSVGDELLKLIGPRFVTALRKDDVIARIGGDEFVLLLGQVNSTAEAESLAARAMNSLREPFLIGDLSILVEASGGLVVAPVDGDQFGDLLRHADVAMYRAKARGASVLRYDGAFDRRTVERLSLLSELRAGLDNDEIFLHYQPKLDLGTGQFSSLEALVRWNHPQRGLIAPSEFIPLAEGSGLITPLMTSVLRQGLQQLALWHEAKIPVGLSVNISARNLLDTGLLPLIRNSLLEAKVAPSSLTLEVTETAVMMDPKRSIEVLREIVALGVGISIDDFGIGHSSMAYLKSLPAKELKVDQAFVSRILTDSADRAIVTATVALGTAMGMSVVAEGVESEAVMELLRDLGCSAVQGFFLARPADAIASTRLLEAAYGLVVDETEAVVGGVVG